MNPHQTRIILVGMLLMLVAIPHGTAQTVKQGESEAPSEQRSFKTPMVLETVFAAADRSLWEASAGKVPGAWFSTQEYQLLGRFSCDSVFLRNAFDKKRGSWKPGLELSVLPAEGGNLTVKVRAWADNPKDNHDRKVDILFDVMNGDKVIASASASKVIEEGDTGHLLATLTLPAAELSSDPMTKLRLKVKTAWD